MFAVNCPYCRHVNKRGARYCADCGAALHLKPCPKCGKVDEVTATRCINCGTAFPTIELADYRPEAESGPAKSGKAGDKDAAHPPALRAGPLIVIALVAGGLPFLWMNRDRLPTPGDLQATPPNRLAVPPPAQLPGTVAPAPVVAPNGPAVSAPAVEAGPAVSGHSGVTPPAHTAAEPRVSTHSTDPRRSVASPPRRVDSPPTERRTAATPAAAVQEPETPRASAPARDCTESLAALGLCDPARSGR
jgi:hypothetical protein